MSHGNGVKVGIDVDDTIEDLLIPWVKYLDEKYGLDVKYEEIKEWDITKFFPTLTSDEIYAPLKTDEFWDLVEPKIGAKRYIKMLIDEGYDVYFVTSTFYKTVCAKYEKVINKYFPFIGWKNVIVTNKKQLIDVDILVDDGVHNLEGGNYRKILFESPTNEWCDKYIKVKTWAECYTMIKTMSVFIKMNR